jgi:hypothetical protein
MKAVQIEYKNIIQAVGLRSSLSNVKNKQYGGAYDRILGEPNKGCVLKGRVQKQYNIKVRSEEKKALSASLPAPRTHLQEEKSSTEDKIMKRKWPP